MTEKNTPTRVADFADVSDSMSAAPATRAVRDSPAEPALLS